MVNPASSSSGMRWLLGAGQQQDAEGEQQDAVEREVALAERLLDEIHLGGGGRGPDHQEPEEGAEADDEDRCVEGQPAQGTRIARARMKK